MKYGLRFSHNRSETREITLISEWESDGCVWIVEMSDVVTAKVRDDMCLGIIGGGAGKRSREADEVGEFMRRQVRAVAMLDSRYQLIS